MKYVNAVIFGICIFAIGMSVFTYINYMPTDLDRIIDDCRKYQVSKVGSKLLMCKIIPGAE